MPNGMLLSSLLFVGGTWSWSGAGRVCGSQRLYCIRLFARSNYVSENCESMAGPGDDLKGKRQRIDPISSSDFFF